jgi:hypothetical protein
MKGNGIEREELLWAKIVIDSQTIEKVKTFES